MRQDRDTMGWLLAVAALAGLLAFDNARRAQQPAPVRVQDGKGGPKPELPPPPGEQNTAATGRFAATPIAIPARGWWQIARRTLTEASDDRVMTEAAGVTYYILLALFPAIAAGVSLYGLIADRGTIAEHLSLLSGFIPGSGMDLITEQVKRVVEKGDGTLGLSALIGLAVSLWSANQAAKALFDALNVVYEEKEKRGFIRLTLMTLTFTLGFTLFAVLALGLVVVMPVVLKMVWLGATIEPLLKWSRWPLMLLVMIFGLSCLYRWGPSRRAAKWRWVSWGSGLAAVLWVGVSLGFSWYVESFGSYNETYGSLGAVVGFMTWIWISAIIVLVGGELNAEMEHQTARDTTIGPEKPLGERGAEMANRVALG